MAEVRKFNTGPRNQVAEAVARAMGEGVRPATPGAPREPGRPAKPTAPNITSANIRGLPTASFLTGFTTAQVHQPHQGEAGKPDPAEG